MLHYESLERFFVSRMRDFKDCESSFVNISLKHLHYQTIGARELEFLNNVHYSHGFQVLIVRCQVSGVTFLTDPVLSGLFYNHL